LPGHSLNAISTAYQYLSSHSFSNAQLHELISYFKTCITRNEMKGWNESSSPIQAFVVGDNERCKSLASKLQSAGLEVRPILYPTVPLGMERLRICLHTFNTRKQVDLLISTLNS
jgi:8-amino-7-oxononanoate synthase